MQASEGYSYNMQSLNQPTVLQQKFDSPFLHFLDFIPRMCASIACGFLIFPSSLVGGWLGD